MNCPRCNESVPAEARFCGVCGQQIAGLGATAAVGGGPADVSSAWAAAAASAPGLPSRIKNIVLSPTTEWPVIAPEPTTAPQLYVGLSPILATLLQLLAGLYGIYVLYLGLPVLMRSPEEKAFGYTASVVTCTILVGIVFAVLSTVAHVGGPRQGLLGQVDLARLEAMKDAGAQSK